MDCIVKQDMFKLNLKMFLPLHASFYGNLYINLHSVCLMQFFEATRQPTLESEVQNETSQPRKSRGYILKAV